MNQLKRILGHLPAILINRKLRQSANYGELKSILEFVNDHPNYLDVVDRHILVKTKFGFSIWCDRKDNIGQTILEEGQWEGLLSRTIQSCLGPGDIAIDIGANMGYDTMLMSTRVGAHGRVFAFEPDHGNLVNLLKNLQLLEHSNVAVGSFAISDRAELASMQVAGESNRGVSNLRPGNPDKSQPAMASRLDSLLTAMDIASDTEIRFVKMDIEGFEWNAIQGMGDLLEQINCLALEINHDFLHQCGGSAKQIFDHMKSMRFQSFCANPSSDGKWVVSDQDFETKATHFDALFCRQIPDNLLPMIA